MSSRPKQPEGAPATPGKRVVQTRSKAREASRKKALAPLTPTRKTRRSRVGKGGKSKRAKKPALAKRSLGTSYIADTQSERIAGARYDFGQTIRFSSGEQWHVPINPTVAGMVLKIYSVVAPSSPVAPSMVRMDRHHPEPRPLSQCKFEWFDVAPDRSGNRTLLRQVDASVPWAELYPSYVKYVAAGKNAKPTVKKYRDDESANDSEDEEDENVSYRELNLSASSVKHLANMDDHMKPFMPREAHPLLSRGVGGGKSEKIGDKAAIELFASLDQFAKMVATYRLVATNEVPPSWKGYLITVDFPPAAQGQDAPSTNLGFGVYIARFHSPRNGDGDFAGPDFNNTNKKVPTTLWTKPRLVVFDKTRAVLASGRENEVPAGLVDSRAINPSAVLVPSVRAFELPPYDLDWSNATVIGSGAHGKAVKAKSASHGNVHVALKTMSANHSALGTTQYRRELWFGLCLSSETADMPASTLVDPAWQRYIVKTYGWLIKGNHFGIVTQFIQGSSLEGVLERLVTPELIKEKESDFTKANTILASIKRGGRAMRIARLDGESKTDSVEDVLNKRLDKLQAQLVRLREDVAKSTPTSVYKPLGYLRDMLRGIVYMHAHRMIHKDIKPGNVLISDAGEVKLADFGCSASIGIYSPVTGSPYFMPPNLPQKTAYKYTDGYADVFAAAMCFQDWLDTDAVRAMPQNSVVIGDVTAIVKRYTTPNVRAPKRASAMLDDVDLMLATLLNKLGLNDASQL